MSLCQVGPCPDLTHSPLGATLQLQLTAQQSSVGSGWINISQLPGDKGERKKETETTFLPICRK